MMKMGSSSTNKMSPKIVEKPSYSNGNTIFNIFEESIDQTLNPETVGISAYRKFTLNKQDRKVIYAFENVDDCDIVKRQSYSAVPSHSEDFSKSSENTQCTSKAKPTGRRMNNINKIELPVGVRERSKKKIKLEDNVLGPNTVLTSQEFSERISTLQQIMRKEEELKVAIACENLRKDQPALLNTDILNTKIDEYRQLVQEARSKLKMKDVMLSNLELARTFQRIVGKSKATSTKNDFSDSQRKCIEDLLKKKKELNRSISIKRKEIAKTDEDVLKLENAVPSMPVKETRSTRAKMNDLEELERLKSDSENVAERIHLLSRIIQSLIPETGRQEDSDLMELMTECEKVSKCKLDDLDDIKALLSGVCSVNLRADSTRMDCFIDAE